MHTPVKKIILLILATVLLAAVFCFSPSIQTSVDVEARTTSDVDNDIAECEKLIASLNAELKELQEQMDELGDLSEEANERATLLAGQIAVLETEVELNNSLLESCEMKRATSQVELELVQDEYEYYEEQFSELMRFIYENGSMSDFELIFSSGSLAEYLERRDDFNSIMDCVSDLTESMNQSYLHYLDLDQEYASAEEKYQQYIDQLASQQAELTTKKEELDKIVDELGLGSSQLTEQYESLSQSITAAKNKLAALKEERQQIYLNEQKATEKSSYISSSKNSSQGFAWPLELGISYRISSYFSTRTNPITGIGTEFHQGLDIACAKGTKILASKGGVVTKAAQYGGYGNCVIIYHGKDSQGRSVTTLYGHASELKCSYGDSVAQGDLIALVGSTGRSTGNHLHFSVLLDGVYVDPDDYLPDGFYTKLPNS